MSSRMATLPIQAEKPTRWRAWMVGSIAALLVAAGMTAYVGLRSDDPAPTTNAPAIVSEAPAVTAPGLGLAQHAGLQRAHGIAVGATSRAGARPSVAKLARLSVVRASNNDDVAIPAEPAGGSCWRIQGPC